MSEVLNIEVVNKVNELIGLDRSLLSSANSKELVLKLNNKINSLRDNFIVKMPCQYNDVSEFGKLCSTIDELSVKFEQASEDHLRIKKLIDEYKSKSNSNQHEQELKDLIFKAITLRRYLIYVQTLITLTQFRL